jgi:hypothetical protein
MKGTNYELLKTLETVANEPFNFKHHVAYIRLALQMVKWLQTPRSQMVNAVPATNGNSHMSIRRVVETS